MDNQDHITEKISLFPKPPLTGSDDHELLISILKKPSELRNEQDLNTLVPLVKNIAFFKEKKIKERDLVDICLRMRYEHLPAGKTVIQYGEYGDKFYLVLRGLVQVWVPEPKNYSKKNLNNMIETLEQKVVEASQQMDQLHMMAGATDIHSQQESPGTNINKRKGISGAGIVGSKSTLDGANHSTVEQHNDDLNDEIATLTDTKSVNDEDLDMIIQDDEIDQSRNSGSKQHSLAQQHQRSNSMPKASIQRKKLTVSINKINQQPHHTHDSQQQLQQYQQQQSQRQLVFRQVATLGDGKSFGELALIQHKPRVATIKTEVDTHFAILDKQNFQRSLGKIEKKYLNKMIDFLKSISCFKSWTRNSVGKYSFFLEKQKFKRGQLVYKEGALANRVFIVKKGDFQLERRMPRDLKDTASQVVQLLGRKPSNQNILARKLPEIRDVPLTMKLMIFGVGSLIGEEDILNREHYSCTLMCYSLRGAIYTIKKEDFMMLRQSDDSWLNIIEKIIQKEQRRRGDFITSENAVLSKISETTIYNKGNNGFTKDEQLQWIAQYHYYKENNCGEIPQYVYLRQRQGNGESNAANEHHYGSEAADVQKDAKLSSLIYLDKQSPEKIYNISKLLKRNGSSDTNNVSSNVQEIMRKGLHNSLKEQLPNQYSNYVSSNQIQSNSILSFYRTQTFPNPTAVSSTGILIHQQKEMQQTNQASLSNSAIFISNRKTFRNSDMLELPQKQQAANINMRSTSTHNRVAYMKQACSLHSQSKPTESQIFTSRKSRQQHNDLVGSNDRLHHHPTQLLNKSYDSVAGGAISRNSGFINYFQNTQKLQQRNNYQINTNNNNVSQNQTQRPLTSKQSIEGWSNSSGNSSRYIITKKNSNMGGLLGDRTELGAPTSASFKNQQLLKILKYQNQ